jgi:hypothetical protein
MPGRRKHLPHGASSSSTTRRRIKRWTSRGDGKKQKRYSQINNYVVVIVSHLRLIIEFRCFMVLMSYFSLSTFFFLSFSLPRSSTLFSYYYFFFHFNVFLYFLNTSPAAAADSKLGKKVKKQKRRKQKSKSNSATNHTLTQQLNTH